MRIAFIGAVRFSLHAFHEVLRHGGEIVLVLTLDPSKSARHADFADLASAAAARNLPVHLVTNINAPDALAVLRAAAPDVIFIFGWSQLVGSELRAIAPCIGTHPALLPQNRGRHPIVWALVHGLEKSGLTFFYIDEGVDSGDILWQRAFAIGPDDDAGLLLTRIEELASAGIAEFLPQLQAGAAPRRPQDHSLANVWRKRTEADGCIDWRQTAREIHNLVRALAAPYPGAHTFMEGHRVSVWRSSPVLDAAGHEAPGTILSASPAECIVRTGDAALRITAWESPLPLHAGMCFSPAPAPDFH